MFLHCEQTFADRLVFSISAFEGRLGVVGGVSVNEAKADASDSICNNRA